jgi:hypothetical protein
VSFIQLVLIECQGHNISHYQDIEVHQIVRLHWSILSSIQHPVSERKLTRITLSVEKIDICCCRQGRHPDEDLSTDHTSRSQHVVRREPVVDDHKDPSPPSRTCLHHIHICITGRLQETDLVSFDHFLSLSLSLSLSLPCTLQSMARENDASSSSSRLHIPLL